MFMHTLGLPPKIMGWETPLCTRPLIASNSGVMQELEEVSKLPVLCSQTRQKWCVMLACNTKGDQFIRVESLIKATFIHLGKVFGFYANIDTNATRIHDHLTALDALSKRPVIYYRHGDILLSLEDYMEVELPGYYKRWDSLLRTFA